MFIPTSPDLFQYVAWPGAFPTAFDYTANTNLAIATRSGISGFSGGDSAVLYYFGSTEAGALTVLPFLPVGATATIFGLPPPKAVEEANQCALTAGQECLISAASLLLDFTPFAPASALLNIGLAAEGVCDAAASFKEGDTPGFVAGSLITATDIASLIKEFDPTGLSDLLACDLGLLEDQCGSFVDIPRCVMDKLNGYAESVTNRVLAVFAGSPIDLQIFDENGNHLLLGASGIVDTTIPRSWLFQVGSESNLVIINNPIGKFQIKVVGKPNAPPGSTFTLAVLEPVELQSDSPYTTIVYEKVPIQSNSIASLDLSDTTATYALRIDINGDNVADSLRTPTSISQCIGDVNNDGKVDLNDVNIVQALNGTACGQNQYDPKADINRDCTIDDIDASLVRNNLLCPNFNQPPSANAGPERTVECTSPSGANVVLNGSASSDPDGDSLTFAWTGPFGTASGPTPTVPLSLGTHTVTLTVDDGSGGTASDTVILTVADTTTPTIGSVNISPNVLWPPNHQMVSVAVAASAADICSAGLNCRIISVSSNEPVNGLGDGDTAPDWQITGDLTVNLRAERSGKGTGRVYTITIRCTDASGNSSTKTTTVAVPHDQGKKK